jgi:hypothetical protein
MACIQIFPNYMFTFSVSTLYTYCDTGYKRGRRDSMVVGFTTTYAISAYQLISSNPAHSEVYSIQHYMIKFVSTLR